MGGSLDQRWRRWCLCVLPLNLVVPWLLWPTGMLCLGLKKLAASISCLLEHLPGALSFHLRSPVTRGPSCKRPQAGTWSMNYPCLESGLPAIPWSMNDPCLESGLPVIPAKGPDMGVKPSHEAAEYNQVTPPVSAVEQYTQPSPAWHTNHEKNKVVLIWPNFLPASFGVMCYAAKITETKCFSFLQLTLFPSKTIFKLLFYNMNVCLLNIRPNPACSPNHSNFFNTYQWSQKMVGWAESSP